MGMSTPCDMRPFLHTIIDIVVNRHLDIISHILVAHILTVERVGRIFKMTSDKELSAASGHHNAHTTLLRHGDELELGVEQDIFLANLGVSAMGHEKLIVETAEDRYLRSKGLLGKDTKHLL